MSVEYIDLGIVLLLNKKTSTYAIELATRIASIIPVNTSVCLGYLPHITVFQGRFPPSKLAEVNTICKDIFKGILPLSITLTTQLLTRPNGNVFWIVNKTPALQTLHEQCLKGLLPLTNGLLMEQSQKALEKSTTSKGDRALIQKFGTVLAGEKFIPHVTLCNIKEIEGSQQLLSELSIPESTWTISEYRMAELRSDGSILNLIV